MASLVFERNLNIRWEDIKTPGNLMLVFHKPKGDQLQSLQNATAWQVVEFYDNGSTEQITYAGNFGVGAVNVGADNVVTTSTWTHVVPGMNVGLNKVDGTNNFKFAPPSMVPDQGNLITVDNLTHTKVDLSVGVYDPATHKYKPTFVFPKVGDGATMAADFHPILYAFVNSDVKESALITANIQVSKAIATINLAAIATDTDWVLTEDDNGAYTLKNA